jgi:anaerobic ribonucleoside-triphosphate reductase
MKYKCARCLHIVESSPCPNCGYEDVEPLCAYDPGVCTYAQGIHTTIVFCPTCGEPMCPECHSHDVIGLSRIAGYYAEVKGWGNGKRAELKDRHHYTLDANKEEEIFYSAAYIL